MTAIFYRRADVFKLISCHRHEVWFDTKKKVEFTYSPKPLEAADGRLCALKLAAFDDKLENAWAYIDFHGDESLAATVSCNGAKDYEAVGVSVCQSMTGLVQLVRFKDEVDYFTTDECPEPQKTPVGYEITLARGKCLYLFQREDGAIHRLTTFGYDDVIMR